MTPAEPSVPLRVLVAGGGIAALETVLALHDLAAERVDVTLIAPESDLLLRPLTVATPFSRGHVDRLPWTDVMADVDGRHRLGALRAVDPPSATVTLDDGHELTYDALVVALGATPVPAFADALSFGAERGALNGVLADLEGGWTHSVAFVVPPGCCWPLPLYELALMTAEETYGMNMDGVALHLVTPENAPLEIFGSAASAAMAELLTAAHITVHTGVEAEVRHGGRVTLAEGEVLIVDRVVALPVLEGPKLEGLPATPDGFVPVDDAGRIEGIDGVHVVGDATDRPIKQGGLACQQADVAAAAIAVRAGAAVVVPPLEQVLRGRLLTGRGERFLRCAPGDPAGRAEAEPLWWPPEKISGRYLSPYLVEKGVVHLPSRTAPAPAGVEVRVAVPGHPRSVPGGVLPHCAGQPRATERRAG